MYMENNLSKHLSLYKDLNLLIMFCAFMFKKTEPIPYPLAPPPLV